MSYYLLINNKVINEGDTVHMSAEGMGMGEIQIKVSKIDPESQSLTVELDALGSEIDIPISAWEGASIIENEGLPNPNLLFKSYRGRNDGQ